jgi:hypothetical protein
LAFLKNKQFDDKKQKATKEIIFIKRQETDTETSRTRTVSDKKLMLAAHSVESLSLFS